MTADEIRALDGPGLTQLAFTLGLAPCDPVGRPYFSAYTFPHSGKTIYHDAAGEVWEPDRFLAQADAVFRQLRARGWMLCNSWRPARCVGRQGYLEAINGLVHIGEHYTDARDEPLALLRCAVLAVASEGDPLP